MWASASRYGRWRWIPSCRSASAAPIFPRSPTNCATTRPTRCCSGSSRPAPAMTVLAGHSLTLRPPRDSDGEGRFALGNDPGIMRMFGADPKDVPPLTLDAARDWIARLAAHPNAWVVEHERRFLGEVRLDDVDRIARHARLAI